MFNKQTTFFNVAGPERALRPEFDRRGLRAVMGLSHYPADLFTWQGGGWWWGQGGGKQSWTVYCALMVEGGGRISSSSSSSSSNNSSSTLIHSDFGL